MAAKRKRGSKENASGKPNVQKKAKGNAGPSAATLEKKPFVEAPIGDERRREAGLYELLGSEDESDRISAADCIISSLFGDQPVPEAVLIRHLDRRLFRGLASGRNASRLGFSLVITEILTQLFGENGLANSTYHGLSFDQVLGFLKDKTQPEGNVPGQEERDHYFGQLFGIECFVRSHILFSDTSKWNTVLDLVLQLGAKKVWLRSQCGWIIVQALDQMSQELTERTLQAVAEASMAKTPEGVAIWIVAMNKFPDLKVKPWKHPLSPKSFAELATVLKENFNDGVEPGEKGNKQASWSAQLPFVWNLLLNHFSKEEESAEDFDQFWNRVVDDSFFSKSATDGQKFKGFMIFQMMLDGLGAQKAKINKLFGKNFMTCLMNQAAKEDRYLHRAATKALKSIEAKAAAFPVTLPTILQNLLGKNGVHNFDQRTSTKTVDKLLQNIDKSNEKKVVSALQKLLASLSEQDETQARAILRSYVDYIGKALNATATPKNDDNKDSQASYSLFLQELSRVAYSEPEDIPSNLLSEQVREQCRSRLEASLAKLTRNADDLTTFCNAIGGIDPSSVPMEDDMKNSTKDALARMNKLLKRKTKTEAERGLTQGLATLHAVSIFQLYNEEADAMESLNDLEQYDARLKKGDTSTGNSEMLVEILLAMVARPSSLMRQVSQQVFESFTSQINSESLSLLTEPLASGESTKGQRELFNTDEDGMDLDEAGSGDEDEDEDDDDNVVDLDDASDIEIDSDVEFVNLDEDSKSGDEDEDEDEAEDDKDADGPIQLDERIGTILKSHRLDKDMDAISSASDGDMSDSEMLALDEKLSEVFKNRVQAKPDTKKQKKDAKQSVVNFKHRILDLLDIYVKHEAHSPLAFSVLSPLLNLMRTTNTKALSGRACETILNYQRGLKKVRSAAKDDDKQEEIDTEDMLTLLVEIHEDAGKDNSHAYAKAASAASLIVASAMYTADQQAIKQVATLYANTQSRWVLGEVKLQNSFFADWNNWCQNHASQARS